MGNGRISAKQAEILEYIKAQILEKGYPPAVREICSVKVNIFGTLSFGDIGKEWLYPP